MSFYNTGNPVPSIDPRDLDDNAKHFDDAIHTYDDTWIDRLGTPRKSWRQIEQNSSYNLITWAYTEAFQVITATRDSNGTITSANIAWPNGVAGVFTPDIISSAFPGAIDSWHATYLGAPIKTITQPAVTRDSNGAVIAQPAITIV